MAVCWNVTGSGDVAAFPPLFSVKDENGSDAVRGLR